MGSVSQSRWLLIHWTQMSHFSSSLLLYAETLLIPAWGYVVRQYSAAIRLAVLYYSFTRHKCTPLHTTFLAWSCLHHATDRFSYMTAPLKKSGRQNNLRGGVDIDDRKA